MTTEQKIREAFRKQFPNGTLNDAFMFAAGYLALLNELVPEMAITDSNFSTHVVETLYRLPEGITK